MHKQAAHKIVAADRLRRAGDLQESEAAAREAIEIDPQNQAPALACLGAVLSDQGRAEEAFGAYEQSLSQHADQPLVYTALAHMCLERGKPEEALLLADKACELAPGLVSAKITRAGVLEKVGRTAEAFSELSLAFRVASHDVDNYVALTEFVAGHGLSDDVRRDVAWQDCEAAAIGAFRAECVDGRRLAAAAGNILSAKCDFAAEPITLDGETLERLSEDELFIRLLQECVISDSAIESFCVRLRRKILIERQGSDELPTAIARLAAALALQNHRNGYVSWSDAEEATVLAAEDSRLSELVQASKSSVTGAARAALQLFAMYRPLAARGDADRLLDLLFGAEAGLLLLTVREEHELLGGETRIEEIGAFEVPPAAPESMIFPWLHFTPPVPGTLMAFLRREIPGHAPPEWSAGSCDILYPLCGSGQHVVTMALALPASRIWAVDPSMHALAYGARRALKLGVENIEFSAGDIAAAGAAEQRFHFIDARRLNGAAGEMLATLAGLLVSGGLLRVELVGKERAELLRGALEIGAKQAEGSLQVARRDISRDGGDACKFLRRQEDFYYLGGCLELIGEAERGGSGADELIDAVTGAGLHLIGQFAPPAVHAYYRNSHGDDPHIRNLAQYEGFMHQHPVDCGGMLRLLCQKAE